MKQCTAMKRIVAVAAPRSRTNAVIQRGFCATPKSLSIVQHFSSVLPSAGVPLLCSPIGTLASLGMTFNVVVCGASHIQYTMDMVARDYLEDDVLYVICRYFLLISLVTIFLQIFIEV